MNELFLHKVPVDTEIPTSIILLNFSAPYPQKSMFFLSITILLEFQSHQPFQTCGLLDFASSLETHEVVQGVKCKPKIYTMCFILLTFLFLNIPRMSWTVCNYSTCKICPLLKTLQRTMFPHFFFSETLSTKNQFWQMQGNCTQCMWVFSTPHFPVLTINVSTQSDPCFICKKQTVQHKNLW